MAQQRRIDVENNNNSMSQPKSNSFFGFEDMIKDMASDKKEEVGLADDAIALTSVDLLQSSILSENLNCKIYFKQK